MKTKMEGFKMIHPRLLKLTYLISFGFLLIGCGSGGTTSTNGTPEKVMGPVSGVSSSTLGMEGSTSDDDDADHFVNCLMTENPDGGFSITCECMAGGVTQGTVTHVFDNSVTRETCTKADGMSGRIITVDGTGTTTFENCLFEKWDRTLTIDGVVNETVHHAVNTCEHTVSTTVDFTTAEACTGLTVMEGEATSAVGLSATLHPNKGPQTVTGAVCIDSVSTEVASLGELKEIVDPAGMCQADLEDDDDQGEDNDDQGEDVNDDD